MVLITPPPLKPDSLRAEAAAAGDKSLSLSSFSLSQSVVVVVGKEEERRGKRRREGERGGEKGKVRERYPSKQEGWRESSRLARTLRHGTKCRTEEKERMFEKRRGWGWLAGWPVHRRLSAAAVRPSAECESCKCRGRHVSSLETQTVSHTRHYCCRYMEKRFLVVFCRCCYRCTQQLTLSLATNVNRQIL